jgi:predicted RNA binding protein YcfA (HicA-like mRNA interferase family)
MTDIPWGALRSLTAREIIQRPYPRRLSLRNQRGSHQRYRHADGRRVTVTHHRPGDTFPMGTLRSMIEIQARRTQGKRSVSGPAQAAARVASRGCQFQGRSSAMRRAGWSAMRASTSAR